MPAPKKLTRLPRRSAVVAFSADEVYAIAELIRRQRGGAAVVMGSLSPRTRNAQVALYQSGEVDFLVATDAIGMGLNMDVDHVAFAGPAQVRRPGAPRCLHPQEIGQIAGRAGRYLRDGTFGVTGEAEDMDEDLVEAVENHRFEPVAAPQWRNSELDFDNLPGAARARWTPAGPRGPELAAEALDETTRSSALAEDATSSARCATRAAPAAAVGGLPDARLPQDARRRASAAGRAPLSEPPDRRRRRLPDDWIAGQFEQLDRTDGEIDTLAARLAGVRTLAYVANRPDWLEDPAHWQGRTRGLEDRLSDALHEKLMARFVDRRDQRPDARPAGARGDAGGRGRRRRR